MGNNFRLTIIVLAVTFSLISQGMCAIELYPFGSSAGDTFLVGTDTSEHPEITLSFGYNLFGKHYRYIYVSLLSSFVMHL